MPKSGIDSLGRHSSHRQFLLNHACRWKVLSQKYCQATVNLTLEIQFLPSLSSIYWQLSFLWFGNVFVKSQGKINYISQTTWHFGFTGNKKRSSTMAL